MMMQHLSGTGKAKKPGAEQPEEGKTRGLGMARTESALCWACDGSSEAPSSIAARMELA